jgi:HPt (histidine-containing phosphotransfer) domain-containing protein
MTNETNPDNNVKIHPPDTRLQKKVGAKNLDAILSPAVMQKAEAVVQKSADAFLEESFSDLDDLNHAWEEWQVSPSTALTAITSAAFSIKSKCGQAGYDLVAALAKSLQLHCEKLAPEAITPKTTSIILWHIESMKSLLTKKIRGDGGEVGTAIMQEIKRLEG